MHIAYIVLGYTIFSCAAGLLMAQWIRVSRERMESDVDSKGEYFPS